MNKIKQLYPPGDFGVWIIIYIELITFGLFFIGFAFSRRSEIDLFNSSQLLLDQRFGFVNTLLLLTSSYFIVKAVSLIKNINTQESFRKASHFILGAIGFGGIFLVIKIIEFTDKYQQGINLSTNTFFMFYFLLTIFHFMHVVLGMLILYNLYNNTKQGLYTILQHQGLESGASYWHMVDLLWIILFPLIYIIR
jgi:nitric oxide reductase NorE protein